VNKILGEFLATAVVIGLAPYARSSGPPLLPPGISADNWITLGDRAGFVITNGDSLVGSTSAVSVAKGYFWHNALLTIIPSAKLHAPDFSASIRDVRSEHRCRPLSL
jgi:hypothetical protein